MSRGTVARRDVLAPALEIKREDSSA